MLSLCHFQEIYKIDKTLSIIKPPHWLSPKSPPDSLMSLTNKGLPPAFARGVLPDNRYKSEK